MTTSKSPRRFLRVAYDAARRALPAHAHKFSPKKFTQHQLLACLVLKLCRLGHDPAYSSLRPTEVPGYHSGPPAAPMRRCQARS